MSNDVLTADPNWIVRLLAPDSGPGESPASYMGIRIYPEPEVIIYIKAGDEGSWVFRIYEASFLESSVHLHSLEQGIRRFLPSANTILAVHLGDCAPDFVKYLELFNLWRHPGIQLGMDTTPGEEQFESVPNNFRLRLEEGVVAMRELLALFFKWYFTDDYTTFMGAFRTSMAPGPVSHDHAIGIVNLARRYSIPSMLPVALMACMQIADPQLLVDGYCDPDGDHEHLDSDDIARLYAAQRRFYRRTISVVRQMFAPEPSEHCTSADGVKCKAALIQLTMEALRRLEAMPLPFEILWHGAKLVTALPEGEGLCSGCADMVRARAEELNLETWRSLPCLLQLPLVGWGQGACDTHNSPSEHAIAPACRFPVEY